MGYRVLGRTEDVFRGHGPRKGLEGPFVMGAGRILYYDPTQGQYWDPTTDFYLEYAEVEFLHEQSMALLNR